MDVVRIEKTDETFRVLYDTKGRFILKALSKEDARVFLKIIFLKIGKKGKLNGI